MLSTPADLQTFGSPDLWISGHLTLRISKPLDIMAQPSDILSSGPLLLSDPALDSVPCSLSSMCFHPGSLPSEVLSSDPMQQVPVLIQKSSSTPSE
ncbi:hypothetical protein DFJ58DRAFT_723585 [Suillus subalutaceus]|uniref:uncharacterized protein n=1 Tax=Suillus subalutaceus TaxID=48586 RepID=UPI001B86006E|nr:uncharacterized protein DFJ58DRAFT_723585 [Suillus subalutaceus]KAG1868324.1 hypothetical protein DFJ58DRAFT_723585 [Suillus subalutaceus]